MLLLDFVPTLAVNILLWTHVILHVIWFNKFIFFVDIEEID